MKIPKDYLMCNLCREVVPVDTMKQYVDSIEWGSFSGTPKMELCCKPCSETKLFKNGNVKGRAYA
ncbi:hypothetical protein ACFL3D_01920 [Candidatus Omnitrophota bacterium]